MVEEILVSSGSLFHRDGPKNIRRRIYDSINVLIALNIVQKTKDKQLIWNGVNPLISTDEPNVQVCSFLYERMGIEANREGKDRTMATEPGHSEGDAPCM